MLWADAAFGHVHLFSVFFANKAAIVGVHIIRKFGCKIVLS